MKQVLRPCSVAHTRLLRHRTGLIWAKAAAPSRSLASASIFTCCIGNIGTFQSVEVDCSRARSTCASGRSSCCSTSSGEFTGFCTRGRSHRGHMRSMTAKAGGGAQAATSQQADGFWTLQGYVLYENEVKKSKFVVRAWPVSSPVEALELIREASDLSASHNCFAYRVGLESRCSDDGEPGGTAGRPIQGAIDGEGLDRVAVLVTRYFGGIKLGAGGLVRAYGGAARECLRLAPRIFAKARSEFVVEVSYDELGIVYGCLDMHRCSRLAEEYGSPGIVHIRALVDANLLESLKASVVDGTGGRRHVKLAQAAESVATTAATTD